MSINKIKILKKVMENPKAREMIEHANEIGGNLSSGWKKCNI